MKGLAPKHIVLALCCAGVVLAFVQSTGVPQAQAWGEIVRGSVGGPAAWRQTLGLTMPLLLAGAAVFLALKGGLFNIGADGQLTVGAAAAVAVGLALPGPLGTVAGCLAAMGAGALWAWPAAWIRAYRGGHEVISTIMLNNIAGFLTVWLAGGVLRDHTQESATTALLRSESWLPDLVQAPPFRLNAGLAVGCAAVAALAVWLDRTVSGYELRLAGAGPRAATFAGVRVNVARLRCMTLSGALAGLAGAIVVFGAEHRFYANFSPGYGFDAIGVALLAGNSAWGLLPSALLFAMLSTGTAAVQLSGVPKGLNGVILAALIVVFAAVRYRRSLSA